jgi:hypothetical protein
MSEKSKKPRVGPAVAIKVMQLPPNVVVVLSVLANGRMTDLSSPGLSQEDADMFVRVLNKALVGQ